MDLEQMTRPNSLEAFQIVFILGIMALNRLQLTDYGRGNKRGSHCKNRIAHKGGIKVSYPLGAIVALPLAPIRLCLTLFYLYWRMMVPRLGFAYLTEQVIKTICP